MIKTTISQIGRQTNKVCVWYKIIAENIYTQLLEVN